MPNKTRTPKRIIFAASLSALAAAALWHWLDADARKMSPPGLPKVPVRSERAEQLPSASERNARAPAASAPASKKGEREKKSESGGAAPARSLPEQAVLVPSGPVPVDVLAQEDSAPDPEGHFVRVKIVRTAMKYPLVRIEERRQREPSSGDETVLGTVSMVADHVMLRLEPGYTSQDLESVASQLGMKIRKAGAASRVFLVSFEATDVHALERSIASLKRSRMVGSPEPDYLVTAN